MAHNLKIGDKVRIKRNYDRLFDPKVGEEAYVWRISKNGFDIEVLTPNMIKHKWGASEFGYYMVELVESAEDHGMSKADIIAKFKAPDPPPFVPKPENVAFWDEALLIIENDQKFLAEARRLKAERERLPSKFGVTRRWEGDYTRLITAVCKDYIAARGGRNECNWHGLPSNRGIKHLLDCVDHAEAV